MFLFVFPIFPVLICFFAQHASIGHLVRSRAPLAANATRTFDDALADLRALGAPKVAWTDVRACFRDTALRVTVRSSTEESAESEGMRSESRQVLRATFVDHATPLDKAVDGIGARMLDVRGMLDLSWQLDCDDLSALDLDSFFIQERLSTASAPPDARAAGMYSFDNFVAFRFHRARQMLALDSDPWIVESVAVFGRVEVALVRLRQLYDELLVSHGVDLIERRGGGGATVAAAATAGGKFQAERVVPTAAFVAEALDDQPLDNVRYPELDSTLRRFKASAAAPLQWSTVEIRVRQLPAAELMFQHAPRSARAIPLPSMSSAPSSVCEVVAEPDTERVWVVTEDGLLRCWDCQVERVVAEFNVFDTDEQARGLSLHSTGVQIIVKPRGCPFVAINSTSTNGTIGTFDAQSGTRVSRALICWPSYQHDGEGAALRPADVASFVLEWVRGLFICALEPLSAHAAAADASMNVNAESNIVVYNAASGAALASFDVPAESRGRYTQLLFVSEWSCLVAASDSGALAVWDTAATLDELRSRGTNPGSGGALFVHGECTQVQHSHHSAVTSMVYLPTAMLVASASLDGTVRLWDIASGRFRLDDPALGAFRRYPGAGGFGTHFAAREQRVSSGSSSSAAVSSFACKLVLRPSDAQLADDLMRPSAKGSVCTRLSVASVCTATQSADIALEQESVEMAEEIDRKVAAHARADPSGSTSLARTLSSGGFLYLLDSGELLSAPAVAFDARFVLLNSARPPPQVRGYALGSASSAAAVDARGYDDLLRVLRDPASVMRVFYVVASAVTLDLAKIKSRLEETGAVAGTRLEMERALPPQAAHFVCFYEPGRADGPERSLNASQLSTGAGVAADRWVPGTVLAAFNNETYDVALDAAQKGADGMLCAVGRARLRIVSADGGVPPLYLPVFAPTGLTSVATYVRTACTRLGGHICTKQDAENVALLLHPQQRAAVLKAWEAFTALDSAERGRIESERGGDEFSGFYLRARDVSAPQLVDIVRSMCSELEQVNFSGARVGGRGGAKGKLKGSAVAKGKEKGKAPSTRGGGKKKKGARGGTGKGKSKSAASSVAAAGIRKMPFGHLYDSDAIRAHAEHVSRTIQLGSLLEAVGKTLAGRGFRRGQRVHVLSEASGEWSPGTVCGVAGQRAYDVSFRRGDDARGVPARLLRARFGREVHPSEMSQRLAGFKCSDMFHRTAAGGGGGGEGTRSRAQLQRAATELATRLRDQVNMVRTEVGDDFEDIATNGGDDLLVDGRAAATAEEVARWLDSDEPTHPLAASLRVRAACEAWLCSALGRLSARRGATNAKPRAAARSDARRAKGTVFFDDILLAFAYVLDGVGDAKAEALSFAAKEQASQRKAGSGLLPGMSVLVLLKGGPTLMLRKQRRGARRSAHAPRVDVLCMDIESDSVGNGGDGGSHMMCYSVGRMVQKVGAHLMSCRLSAATEAQARERFDGTWRAGLARYRARLPAVRMSVRSTRAHEEDCQGQVAARIRGFWIDACGVDARGSGGARVPSTVLTRTAAERFAQSLESVVTLRSHAIEGKRAVILFSRTFLDMMLREQVLAFERAKDAADVAEFSISPIDAVESFARLVAAHPVALHLLAHVIERDEEGESLLLAELVALVVAEPQGVYSPAAIDPATNRLSVPVLIAHLLRAIARVHSSRVSAATVHDFLRFLGVFKSAALQHGGEGERAIQTGGGVTRASAGIIAMLTDVNLPRSVNEGSKRLRAVIQKVESSCAARVSSGHLEHTAWVSKHGVWQRTLKGNRIRLRDALAPLKNCAVDGLLLSAQRRLLVKAPPRGGRRHWDGARAALATSALEASEEGELTSFDMHRSATNIRARSSAACGIVARGGSFDGGRRCVVVMHAGDQHIGGRGGGEEGERDDSLWDNVRVQVELRQQDWLQTQLWVPRLLGAWPDLRCASASGDGLPESFALALEEALPGFTSLEELVLASKVAATSSCYLLSDVALTRKRLRFVPTLVLRYWLSEVVDALLTLHEHGVASWAVRPSAIAIGPGRVVLTNLWCSRVAKQSVEGDGGVAVVASSPGTEGPPLQPQGRTQRIFDGCVALLTRLFLFFDYCSASGHLSHVLDFALHCPLALPVFQIRPPGASRNVCKGPVRRGRVRHGHLAVWLSHSRALVRARAEFEAAADGSQRRGGGVERRKSERLLDAACCPVRSRRRGRRWSDCGGCLDRDAGGCARCRHVWRSPIGRGRARCGVGAPGVGSRPRQLGRHRRALPAGAHGRGQRACIPTVWSPLFRLLTAAAPIPSPPRHRCGHRE